MANSPSIPPNKTWPLEKKQANGESYWSNLHTWLLAVTKLYYNVHAFEHVHFIKPLLECCLSTFANVQWIRQGGAKKQSQ
jgi:hypothetical protein